MNHHALVGQIGQLDRRFPFLTLAFLMGIAFIPFSTRAVGEHIRPNGARAAALTYGGTTLTLSAVTFCAICFYASVGWRVLRDDADSRTVSGFARSYLPGPRVHLTGTFVAVLSPTGSSLLFETFGLLYVVESSTFGRRETV